MQKTKASTIDILGAAEQPKINSKWRRHYERLIHLREKLHHRKGELSDSAKEEMPTFSLHMADAGTDQYDQDFALSMMSSEQTVLYDIDEALNRIRNGS